MSALIAVLAFVFAISVLITVHEFGHFWVARRMGVKVLRFSIGFGRPLWKRVSRDGTEYVIAALPLGGYVKMLDEREGDVAPEDLPYAFNRKSLPARTAIVAAGPAFNFIFAILAYWAVFMLGVPGIKPIVGETVPDTPAAAAGFQPQDRVLNVNGAPTPTWDVVTLELLDGILGDDLIQIEVESRAGARRVLELQVPPNTRELTEPGALMSGLGLQLWMPPLQPVIGELQPGGSAMQAGLRRGDRILDAGGRVIEDWQEWVEFVRAHPGETVNLRVQRNGDIVETALAIGSVEEDGIRIGRIGAGVQVPDDYAAELRAEQRYGPVAAVPAAVGKTWEISVLTLRLLGRMLMGDVSIKNISGPINIAQYAGFTASVGLVPFLMFLAVISVSLGVLNLLPIPILDGGHLAYFAVEAVKGSPVSERTEMLGQKIGILVLLLLMGFAFYNDLARLFAN